MARLQKLKEEAAQAQNNAMQRKIEQERLQKEAELKLVKIRRQQSEEAARRQQQEAFEAAKYSQEKHQQEKENEQRLAMLHQQAEKMRKELGGDLTGGATVEAAVAELKRITKQKEKIEAGFDTELQKQTRELTAFYDRKIASLADTSPWDREFETEADYKARLAEAERKVAPARQEKSRKMASLRQELTSARDSQIKPLEKQINTLLAKRFTVSASAVLFKFTSYKVAGEVMLGELTMSGKMMNFYCFIPKKKAKQYKQNPELLVPEVVVQATLTGLKTDKIKFHGSDNTFNGWSYKASGRRFADQGDGTVFDTETWLMWANKDNGRDIDWSKARNYCATYTGGGYTDWRLPAQDELAELYKAGIRNKKSIIQITSCCPWASETRGSWAAYFHFGFGSVSSSIQSNTDRVLPVRSDK